MKKALVVGINHYKDISPLHGCVNDAHAVKGMLERNADGSVNFGVRLLSGKSAERTVDRAALRSAIKELFSDDSETVLLYFAGHGYVESSGGYLCPSDCKSGDDGIALSEVMTWANTSKSRNKIIILDSCHSGVTGNSSLSPVSELSEGVTILTASTAEQYASEDNGSGVFTNLLVDALAGAAANLVGDVTPGAIYAHIDQSLGPWAQRPVFKTNVKSFVSLRRIQPVLPLEDLRQIAELFPKPGYAFSLDPAFEPERADGAEALPDYVAPDPEKNRVFAILQKYNRVNLIVPDDAPHMWHAAMESKSCSLTVLGEHYRKLVAQNLI